MDIAFCARDITAVNKKITNIIYKGTSSGGEIVIQATGPIKYSSQLLSNPLRIAVDINDVVLSLQKEPDIKNDLVKSIRVSQYSLKPDIVRVVVELNKPLAVRIASRINLDEVKLKLNYTNEDMATPDVTPIPAVRSQEHVTQPSTQKMLGIQFERKDDIRKILITTTGPVSYEWHRLKSPDSRIYIDFTDAVLIEKKLSVPVEDDIVSDIRVAQNRLSPNVVRIVFKLSKPLKVTFLKSQSVANQLIIEIGKEKENESVMAKIGTGFIGYLSTGKIIVIDPGHGGGDYGAINPQTGLAEKEVTLDVSLRLQELLIQDGWNVILTHSTDRDVTSSDSSDSEELWARANIANQGQASFFISIHCDACSNENVRGSTTFYCKDVDKPFAMALHKSLISNLKTADRGTKSATFYVLKHTTMPAALIEIAFISNSEDAKLLSAPDFRQKVARAIFEGLYEYIGGPVIIGGK
ncbi:MAG: N-acetylmuramoyl-L-alanine amidase LytC precursor [bacterium ADurb.Bin363]|nr:MAG: N-acetylmuramoyl-L-alanine amidase LytC precursor [bacterium ADurb.Bin363]